MTIGKALEEVKNGKGMRLPHWAKDTTVRMKFPDEYSDMTEPYLYVDSQMLGRWPWRESMEELLSQKWEIVE